MKNICQSQKPVVPCLTPASGEDSCIGSLYKDCDNDCKSYAKVATILGWLRVTLIAAWWEKHTAEAESNVTAYQFKEGISRLYVYISCIDWWMASNSFIKCALMRESLPLEGQNYGRIQLGHCPLWMSVMRWQVYEKNLWIKTIFSSEPADVKIQIRSILALIILTWKMVLLIAT